MQNVFDVLQWIMIIALVVKARQLAQEGHAHCHEIGNLQGELHDVDPVRFAHYAPTEDTP